MISGVIGLTDIHVDRTGAVAGSYRTLEAARDYLRTQPRRTRGTTVWVHPGVYRPLQLDARDSYTTYSVVDGAGPAIISAGIEVPAAAFSVIGQGPLVRADLFAHGIRSSDLGHMVSGDSIHECQHEKTDLIFNGERMTLARWPNIGIDGFWKFANVDAVDGTVLTINTTVQPEAARIARWAHEPNPWIHGYWTFDWTDSYVGITNVSVAGGAGDTLTFAQRPPTTPIKKDARLYGVNLLCELDAPNEYFINEANGTLYFYPPEPFDRWAPNAIAVLSAGAVALNVSSTTGVTVRGLTVEASQRVGILAEGVEALLLDGVVSRNHGTTGILLNGSESTIAGALVEDTGCVGVQVSGGDLPSLSPGNNRLVGSTVRRPARWKRTYMAGVRWGGVNNSFVSNHVSDGPHNCMLGGGNEIPAALCTHENNTLERCAFEASDTGAWYSCGQKGTWVNRGNVARRNTFRDIRCRIQSRSVEGCQGGVQAVYLDDQISGWRFENNSFVDCEVGLFIGGGRSTVATGNVFTNCSRTAVHLDNRGMNWESMECAGNGTAAYAEVVAVLNGPSGAEWRRRWGPELLNISGMDHLCVPVYNRITDNVYSDCGRFIDAGDDDLAAWLDVVTRNRNASASASVAAAAAAAVAAAASTVTVEQQIEEAVSRRAVVEAR